jgi:glycosyltransferase involved in cell wall biosynthesis
MPTLNSERTIALALGAIRRQTLDADDVEILIADGGSTDRTREIAEQHGARILENPRVLPEDGISVAMGAARGRFALTMGSDEVIVNPTSFATKIRIFEGNPRVHNIVFDGLRNPRGYPSIGNYVNRCGDPFSYFMHRIDSGDHFHALARHYAVVREEPEYRIVAIGKHQAFPIVDGHFFRLEHLRTIADPTDHRVIARLFLTMAEKDRMLAVVKDDIIDHYSTARYRTAKAKIDWRIIGNLHHADGGMAGYANREQAQPLAFRIRKYLFIPYSLSVAAPAVDAAILAIRCRSAGMLYHMPLTVGTGVTLLKHGALKLLGRKPPQKIYGA